MLKEYFYVNEPEYAHVEKFILVGRVMRIFINVCCPRPGLIRVFRDIPATIFAGAFLLSVVV